MKTLTLSDKTNQALIDDVDYKRLSKYVWHACKRRTTTYAYRISKRRGRRIKVYLHRAVLHATAGLVVDHRDADGLNNTRSNLRLCTRRQNGQNRGKPSNNQTGYKGVHLVKKTGRYMAYITCNLIRFNLGSSFATAEDAARAYNAKAAILHGEFAYLNVIP